jgi:hypothetical protein
MKIKKTQHQKKKTKKKPSFVKNLIFFETLKEQQVFKNSPKKKQIQKRRNQKSMMSVMYQTPGVYNPPHMNTYHHPHPGMTCKFMNVSIHPALMKFVIGTKGYYFNAITKASGACYIWYHRHLNMIELWGTPCSIMNAETRLGMRCEYISQENERRVMEEIDSEQCVNRIGSWADVSDDEEF